MAMLSEPATAPDRLIRFGAVAGVDLTGALCTVPSDVHVTGTLTADGDVIAAGISGKDHRHATPSGMSEAPQ